MAATGADMLGGALQHLLAPLNIEVRTDVGDLGEIDPGTVAIAQLLIVAVEPTPQLGRWLIRWELWLCVPSKDPADSERELNQLLPDVVEQLETVSWLTWDKATRETHPSNFAAWRLELTHLND